MPEVQEIEISWDATLDGILEGDLTYENSKLSTEQGLATAIIISLFTDRKAADDDILPDITSKDRRGWWGDLANPEETGDQIGSLLWLLERSKTTEEVIVKAKRFVEEALEWLITDNIATNVNATVERQGLPGNDRLAIKVQIILVEGKDVTIRIKDLLN